MENTLENKGQKLKLTTLGFTLIELLAVIVILAIIALIAVPIILNIIKDSKEESKERSIDNIIHAARIYATKELLGENEAVHIKEIKDMMDGEKPETGIIYFNNKGEVAFSLEYEDQIYVKSFEGDIEREDKLYYIKSVSTQPNVETELFLDGPITKEKVEKVITIPTNQIPSDVIGSWDVTHNPDNKEEIKGKVMAWYTDEDSNGLYEVYIGQTGGIKANPDSIKLFNYLINVKEIDVTYLDTKNVTEMSGFFQYCFELKKILGLENFDTSQVTNMKFMFSMCQKLESINLNNFDTNNVTNLSAMFQNCVSLTELDVSSFNTSDVTTMRLMFAGAKSNEVSNYMNLERIIGIENFDTSNVTDMYCLFQCCQKLKEIDLRKWDTGKVTDMTYMFNGTSNLKPIYIGSKWKIAPTNDNMFYNSKTTSASEMCGPDSTHSYCTLN